MSAAGPSVLMLTPDRQVDRRIMLQADSLEAAGWRVTVVAMPLDRPAEDHPRVVRIETRGECGRRVNMVLRAYREVRRRVPMNGWLMRGLKLFAWRYLVNQESFYSRLFQRTASRFHADIIVAHDLPMLPVASELATAMGSRVIYDSHELFCEQELSAWEKRKWGEIEARYIGRVAKVVTVNPSIATELARRYGLSRVEVVYNADRSRKVPERVRVFHDIFRLVPGQRVLLFQGGLSAGRSLEVLVDAMGLVGGESVVLVILGDGLLLRRLMNRAKRRGLRNRVFFHPAVPQADLLKYTASADAGVIPYQATCLNNYWCTPNKLFEFIAAGIPILAADLPELRTFVEGKGIGLVGDISTPARLAGMIDRFFEDPKRWIIWRERLCSVRKEVSWEQEERKVLEIYRDCINSPRGATVGNLPP